MNILAVANQKGGVGKTSTTVNLAYALARLNKRVLLVDLDPQASLTQYFLDSPASLEETVFHLLIKRTPIRQLPLTDNVDLLPANIDLSAAEVLLPAELNKERRLSLGLKHYPDYDIAIIDCPPSLGVLTTNALTATNRLLIPVETDLMAERTVPLILETVENVRDSELNPTLKVWKILPTKYNSRLLHNKEIFEALKAKYDRLVYREPVVLTTKYKDAVTNRSDISKLDKDLGEYWNRLARLFVKSTEEE